MLNLNLFGFIWKSSLGEELHFHRIIDESFLRLSENDENFFTVPNNDKQTKKSNILV